MKRILSIDGGGIRGIIPAMLCQEIENTSKRRIYQLFDLIAGTSTGGILALGYCYPKEGFPSASLVEFYLKKGPKIFSSPTWSWFTYVVPKYDTKELDLVLREEFKNVRISEAVTDVMLTSYDMHLRRPKTFKSWKAKEDAKSDFLMREAARATASAPTYFPPSSIGEASLVDGGVVANNPAGVAYAEARRRWPNEDLILVSLGTGALTRSIRHESSSKWGSAQWARPVIDCMFDANAKAVDYMMRQTVAGSYWRFQVELTEQAGELDNASAENMDELRRLATKMIDVEKDRIQQLVSSLMEDKEVLSGQICTPADGSMVDALECSVTGNVRGFSNQRLYLFTGGNGRFWPFGPIKIESNGQWRGKVNVGDRSESATISLVDVRDTWLEDYIRFYREHNTDVRNCGINLTELPTVLDRCSVRVNLSPASP
jgi:patatin-like phospholipase/acyl hydrolase